MVKLFAVILSLCLGALSGFLFNYYLDTSIVATIFIALGFAVAALLLQIILFFVTFFLLGIPENKNKVRTHQSKFYHSMMMIAERIILSTFSMKCHCNGKEMMSPYEQYVVVANHRSNLDNMMMDVYLKEFKMVFVAKKSLFKAPLIGKFIHGNAYILLDRGNVQQEFEAFNIAHDMLTREKEPHSIGIFPEGTRNGNLDNKDVQAFHPGSFRMAIRAKKPIAIVALRGTKEVNNNLLFKRHPCYLDVIEVLEYEQYKDKDVNYLASYCQNKIQSFLKEVLK